MYLQILSNQVTYFWKCPKKFLVVIDIFCRYSLLNSKKGVLGVPNVSQSPPQELEQGGRSPPKVIESPYSGFPD